jgi:hypothetical protein
MSADDTPPPVAPPGSQRPEPGQDRPEPGQDRPEPGQGGTSAPGSGTPAGDDRFASTVARLRPGLRAEALPLPARDILRETLVAGMGELNRQRIPAPAERAAVPADQPAAEPDDAPVAEPADAPVAEPENAWFDEPDVGPVALEPATGPAGPVAREPATGPVGPQHRPSIGSLPRPRRPGRLPRRVAAWGTAVMLAAASGAAVLVLSHDSPRRTVEVTASTVLADAVSSDPASTVVVRFSQSLDHPSVVAGLRLSPAVQVRTSWQGDVLRLAPVNGFAPNTAYLISVNGAVARTASGRALTSDVTAGFGTARAADAGPADQAPTPLSRLLVARAAADSEAVVLSDGSILATAASSPASGSESPGLLRVRDGVASRLGPAVDAICVSRSGVSVAYLYGSGPSARIVLADAQGRPQGQVQVDADPTTPLGWIGDAEVSFVSGGRLQAVDRSGRVRVLSSRPVDAARDALALAPGGRYAYHSAGTGPGAVIDLRTGRRYPLPGIVGAPAFSADGAHVSWIQGSGGVTRLATAPSGGGPVLSVPLPVGPGDTVSDLAPSPTGALLAYTVTQGSHGHPELRVASAADGRIVGVSELGAGQSPNWTPSGDGFTVLGHGPRGGQIQLITVPPSLSSRADAVAAVVRGFADAQLDADLDAQRALTAGTVALPSITGATRAQLVRVEAGPAGTATALVRLTADATATTPTVRQAEETIRVDASGGVPRVIRVSLGAFRTAPAGPQLAGLDTDARPGTVLLRFDSDLDPATVASGVTLATADGTPVAAVTGYDVTTRTVSLRPAQPRPGGTSLMVRLTATLHDIAGRAPADPGPIPVTTGG